MSEPTKKKNKPSYLNFNHSTYVWKADIDYRQNPNEYQIGKGEQGVLTCQPYKSEILPYWKFKDSTRAKKSSEKIYKLFLDYLDDDDFVGADMARKFLQMGYTRARRYANYKGGKKYDKSNNYQELERGTGTLEKAESAEIFKQAWKEAEANEKYSRLKKEWRSNN